MSGDLPSGWEWTTVGVVADTQLGKTLSTKPVDGGRLKPYLRNKNVQWFRVDVDDLKETYFTGEEESKYQLRPGDLLVCEGGEVGRCAIWQHQKEDLHFQNALHRVRPQEGVLSEWLQFSLRWAADTGRLVPHTSGVTISHLVQRALRKVEIPLPPTDEQERIVSAIEEHFSRLDAVESAVDAAQQKLVAFRRSSFDQLFDEPDWTWTTLGEIAEVKGGVTKDSKSQGNPAYIEVPYLRVANVQRGYLNLDEVTTIRVNPEKAARLKLQSGDILFNEGGDRDKLGRGWVWEGQIEDCIHQNHVLRARLTSEAFDPYFVSMHGNSWGQRWFEAHGKQTTNLASLNLTTLKSFPVPAPPLDEQREVVARLKEIMDLEGRLRKELDQAKRHSGSLRRSILADAFSGRLVPQDPNDEPAASLLDRISEARLACSA